MNSHSLLSLKYHGTPSKMSNVQYVTQSFSFNGKQFMVYDGSSICANYIYILATAVCLRFRVFPHVITKAYLQSKFRMSHHEHIDPKRGDPHLFGLKQDEVLKLELPLCVVCDVRDNWIKAVYEHNDIKLVTKSTPCDLLHDVETSKQDVSVAEDEEPGNCVSNSPIAINYVVIGLTEFSRDGSNQSCACQKLLTIMEHLLEKCLSTRCNTSKATTQRT